LAGCEIGVARFTRRPAMRQTPFLDLTEKQLREPRYHWDQLESAFVERRPYGKNPNVFTEHARASNELRVRLFRMAIEDEKTGLDRGDQPGERLETVSPCTIQKLVHVRRVLGGTAGRRGYRRDGLYPFRRWRLEGLTVSDEAG
jgi:hypothetical protein